MYTLITQFLLLFLALASYAPLGAQTPNQRSPSVRLSVGPSVGFDGITYTTNGKISTSSEERVKTTFTAPVYGISALLDFPSRWSLLGELAYEQFTFTHEQDLYTIGGNTAVRTWTYEQEAINTDILLRYAISTAQPTLFAEAGMNVALPFSSRARRRLDYREQSHVEKEWDIDGYDYGLVLGIGARFQRMELRSRFALTDRATHPERFTSVRAGIRLAYRLGRAG